MGEAQHILGLVGGVQVAQSAAEARALPEGVGSMPRRRGPTGSRRRGPGKPCGIYKTVSIRMKYLTISKWHWMNEALPEGVDEGARSPEAPGYLQIRWH